MSLTTSATNVNDFIDITFKQWIRVHMYMHNNINAVVRFPDAQLIPNQTQVISPAVYDDAILTTSFNGFTGTIVFEPNSLLTMNNANNQVVFLPPIVTKTIRFVHIVGASSCGHLFTYSFAEIV